MPAALRNSVGVKDMGAEQNSIISMAKMKDAMKYDIFGLVEAVFITRLL